MKNMVRFIGFIAVLAIIGLSMTACDSDNATKFEGRWLNLAATTEHGFSDFSFTFTGNNFVNRSVNPDRNITRRGTFTYSDTTITFIPAQGESWSRFTQAYTLSSTVLFLAQGGTFGFGPFTRQ